MGVRLGGIRVCLQKKAITIQDALSAVDVAEAYFKRSRLHQEFYRFFDATVQIAEQHSINKSERGIDDAQLDIKKEVSLINFQLLLSYACDFLSGELESWFESQHMPPVLAMKSWKLIMEECLQWPWKTPATRMVNCE